MDKDGDEGRTMTRQDTENGEGRNLFACDRHTDARPAKIRRGAPGEAASSSLFGCGGDETSDTMQCNKRRMEERRGQTMTAAGRGGDAVDRCRSNLNTIY